MADTWWVTAEPTFNATPKYMFALSNGGSQVIRIRRVMFLNLSMGAVTGVLVAGNIDRYTGSISITGGMAIGGATAKDTNNTALDNITMVDSPTAIGGTQATFGRWLWSTDEPAIGTVSLDELLGMNPGWVIWDLGSDNSNLQPLTIRNGEMFVIQATAYSAAAAGLLDLYVEFTSE